MPKSPKSPKKTGRQAALSLVEVRLEPAITVAQKQGGPLEVELPGGAVVKLSHENQLGLLGKLLGELSC